MRNVDSMHRRLLSAAFAVLWSAPGTVYPAEAEGPRGPGPLHRPGKVVHKQVKIVLPARQHGNTCRATVSIRYSQSGEQARVSAEIQNEDCAASTGNYELQLRITDASGERHTLSFSEDWSRDNLLPVVMDQSYDIGTDVILASARLKASSCQCANEPEGIEKLTSRPE